MKCNFKTLFPKLLSVVAIAAWVVLFIPSGQAEPLGVGASAPAFTLKNVDTKDVSLADFADKEALVVVFSCNSCPFAIAYQDRLIALQKDYAAKGVQFVVINSNDVAKKPEDSYENMQKRAAEKSFPFPYLYDETQTIAKAYGAARTPEAYLLDKNRNVAYQGRIDDNTEEKDVKVRDLKNALDLLLSGQAEKIDPKVTKAFGCTIKWKA